MIAKLIGHQHSVCNLLRRCHVHKPGGDMTKYGAKASEKVERAIHEMKQGSLKSGRYGEPVKSRAQAIAIGLSEARQEGGKVPKKAATRTPARKVVKTAAKKAAGAQPARNKVAKMPARKSPAKKTAAKSKR
jgi:hypothetical protein